MKGRPDKSFFKEIPKLCFRAKLNVEELPNIKFIYDGSHLLVVGGEYTRETEKCSIESGSVTCTSQNPELDYYSKYPELFLVPESFCKA